MLVKQLILERFTKEPKKMFDNVLVTQFIYYNEIGESLKTIIDDSFQDETESEKCQKLKCVLSCLQDSKPSLGTYYLKAYMKELLTIVTTLNTDEAIEKSIKELPNINLIRVEDLLLINHYLSSVKKLIKDVLSNFNVETFEGSKLIKR